MWLRPCVQFYFQNGLTGMLERAYVQKVIYSVGQYVQKVLCSEDFMFNSSYVQKVLYSVASMFKRSVCSEGSCSEGSMFRRSYVQKLLYSEAHMLRMSFIKKRETAQTAPQEETQGAA